MADYKTKLESVKEKVRTILEKHEEARNNDNYLVLLFWIKEDESGIVSLDRVSKLTGLKDIYNARSEIQNHECILLPTRPGVLKARRIKFENVKAYYGAQNEITKDYEKSVYGL